MNGVLIIDKPAGPTSHDVVMMVKKKLRARKVGHIGTLDPLATGVLPLCINDATRLARFLEDGKKEYLATIKLGEETDTYDSEGKVAATGDTTEITRENIVSVINDFKGRIKQIPPMFSAIKVNGIPLHTLTRQGIEIERKPREVEIYTIEISEIVLPFITMRTACSKGTYIRSLAFDIGRKLGCGAHLTSLRRTKSGMFSLADSVSWEGFDAEDIIPVEKLFAHIRDIEVDAITAQKIGNGMAPKIFASLERGDMVRFSSAGKMLALATYRGKDEFQLERVFKIQ